MPGPVRRAAGCSSSGFLAGGWSLAEAAAAAGVSERTARKWVARFEAEGDRGLFDRSSAPKRVPQRTPSDRVEAIEALRRLRLTAAEIAEASGWRSRPCRSG
jgi:transposase